jgi:hypothetical protein
MLTPLEVFHNYLIKPGIYQGDIILSNIILLQFFSSAFVERQHENPNEKLVPMPLFIEKSTCIISPNLLSAASKVAKTLKYSRIQKSK